MPALEALTTYLRSVTGSPLALRALEDPIDGLPAYLRLSYGLFVGELFGQKAVFAVRSGATGTAKTLRSEHEQLETAVRLGRVVLVLDGISSSTRARLVQAGLPFVVPGRQVFLPGQLVDLRERQPRRAERPGGKLGWPAQVALFRHLLWGDVQGRMLSEVAGATGLSAMSVSHAKRDLEAAGLAEARTEGRTKRLAFDAGERELWERARGLLRKPWRKLHSVELRQGATTAVPQELRTWASGVDALAQTTSIAPGAIPTVAMETKTLRRALDQAGLAPAAEPDEADLLIEAWMYDPGSLTANDAVDPLSLWLCLHDDPDERVQIALEAHMRSLPW